MMVVNSPTPSRMLCAMYACAISGASRIMHEAADVDDAGVQQRGHRRRRLHDRLHPAVKRDLRGLEEHAEHEQDARHACSDRRGCVRALRVHDVDPQRSELRRRCSTIRRHEAGVGEPAQQELLVRDDDRLPARSIERQQLVQADVGANHATASTSRWFEVTSTVTALSVGRSQRR